MNRGLMIGVFAIAVIATLAFSFAITGHSIFSSIFGGGSESNSLTGGVGLEKAFNEVYANYYGPERIEKCKDASVDLRFPVTGEISGKHEEKIDCKNLNSSECAREIIKNTEKSENLANKECEDERGIENKKMKDRITEFEKNCDGLLDIAGNHLCDKQEKTVNGVSCSVQNGCLVLWVAPNGRIDGKCRIRRKTNSTKWEVIPLGDWNCAVFGGEQYVVKCESEDTYFSFKGECFQKQATKKKTSKIL